MYYGKHPYVFLKEFSNNVGLRERPPDGEFQTRIVNSYIKRMGNQRQPSFLFTNLIHPTQITTMERRRVRTRRSESPTRPSTTLTTSVS